MNKFDCLEIFNKVNAKASYYRIPDEYQLNIRLGIDSNGYQCIRFIGKFEKIKIRSTKNI